MENNRRVLFFEAEARGGGSNRAARRGAPTEDGNKTSRSARIARDFAVRIEVRDFSRAALIVAERLQQLERQGAKLSIAN
jgi:hypothetical protein